MTLSNAGGAALRMQVVLLSGCSASIYGLVVLMLFTTRLVI
jgi:hypothetical protein